MSKQNVKRFINWIYIMLSIVAITYSCLNLYIKWQERSEVARKDFFPVQDQYGNDVNIFEFERYLESRGATRIIKGFYYKPNGNNAICYDFIRNNVRYVLDNEIMPTNDDSGTVSIKSRLSVYYDYVIYRTDYLTSTNYVMDYRSPMWVNEDIYEVLRYVFDNDDIHNEFECPFYGMELDHYQEDEQGCITRHDKGF